MPMYVPFFQEGVKLVKTPPCFSLGMDDWLVDIDFEEDRSHDQHSTSHDPSHEHWHDSNEAQDLDNFFDDDDILILSQDCH